MAPPRTAPLLHGTRVLLRPWRKDDRDALARMQANPQVMAHLMPVPDRAASDAVADRIATHFGQHGFGLWVVEVPGTCSFAGYTGLVHVPYEAHFTPAVEIGWRFDPAFWGHGYATEAARLCLAYGFTRLDLAEIVALTVPANMRSRAVMERLGMARRAEEDFDHPHVPPGHPLRRHVIYRLSRAVWTAQGEPRPDAPFAEEAPPQ